MSTSTNTEIQTPTQDPAQSDAGSIAAELHALRTEVARLNGHRYVRLHNSVIKLGLYQFYRGLAFGLGSVIGATILVSVLVYFLSQIDFLPIIGEWAAQIAADIQLGD